MAEPSAARHCQKRPAMRPEVWAAAAAAAAGPGGEAAALPAAVRRLLAGLPTAPAVRAALAALGVGAAAWVLAALRAGRRRRELDRAAARTAAALDRALAAQAKALAALPEDDAKVVERVLSLDVTGLLEAMQKRRLTSEQIVRVYARRCLVEAPRLNALTQELFEEALEAARASDARRARGERPRLLEGIPVSTKDCLRQRGCYSTCGVACRVDEVDVEDGVLVAALRAAGAIPFVRSNTPQIMMVPESMNYIFGRVLNPWDEARTSGGSSGGEAALVAARASPLGLGSDIGGSVRIPAHFSGLYCLKVRPLSPLRPVHLFPRSAEPERRGLTDDCAVAGCSPRPTGCRGSGA